MSGVCVDGEPGRMPKGSLLEKKRKATPVASTKTKARKTPAESAKIKAKGKKVTKKPEKTENGDKTEKADRTEKADKTEKGGKTDRGGASEKDSKDEDELLHSTDSRTARAGSACSAFPLAMISRSDVKGMLPATRSWGGVAS